MVPARVVKATAGLGKTKSVVDEAKAFPGFVEIYVPTLQLANEVLKNFTDPLSTTYATVIEGRIPADITKPPLCMKSALALQVQSAGLSVYSTLCSRMQGGQVKLCEFYNQCAYNRQFKGVNLRIYTHAYLSLERTPLDFNHPDIAVIDESFYQSCIEIKQLPMLSLAAVLLANPNYRILRTIRNALNTGLPLLDVLRSRHGVKAIASLRNEMEQRAGKLFDPGSLPGKQRVQLDQAKQLNLVAMLLLALETEMAKRVGHSQTVTCDSCGVINVYRRKRISRFDDQARRTGVHKTKVVILDADADEKIIGQFFNVTSMDRIPAQRNCRVVQCNSTRGSKTSLVPALNSDPRSKANAQLRLSELQSFIDHQNTHGVKVLVVGPQAVTGNPKNGVQPLLRCPSLASFAHFGAIRGSNDWKTFDAVIILGRNEPSVEALEGAARALFGSDTDLQLGEDWEEQQLGYRMADGQMRDVGVLVHPDHHVQTLVEQVREAESLQSIDRLRLVHSKAVKTVYVLSSIPLDIDVDVLATWDEIVVGSRLQQAMYRLNGVLPLAADWLSQEFPDLWCSCGAAKGDLKRGELKGQFANSVSISNSPLLTYNYRVGTQRRWSRCVTHIQSHAQVLVELQALRGLSSAVLSPAPPQLAS